MTGRVNGGSFNQGTNAHIGWGDGDLNPLGLTQSNRSIGPAGIARNLYWRISADTISSASNSTLQSFVNGSAKNQLITVQGSSAAGDHGDLSNTDSLVNGDIVTLHQIVGAGGTNITPPLYGMCFQAGLRQTTHTWISSNHTISATGTNFYNWCGQRQVTTETSPDVRLQLRIVGVINRFVAECVTTNHTVDVTFKSRLNTADGGMVFTVANGSGVHEAGDLSGSDTVVAGDLYDSSLATASGTGVFAATTTYVDVTTYDRTHQVVCSNVAGSFPWLASTTVWEALQCKQSDDTTAESTAQSQLQVATVLSVAEFYQSANDAAVTLTLRNNGANAGPSISTTKGSAAGWSGDLSSTATYLPTDEGNWQAVIGAGTQTMPEFLSAKGWLGGPGSLQLMGVGI